MFTLVFDKVNVNCKGGMYHGTKLGSENTSFSPSLG